MKSPAPRAETRKDNADKLAALGQMFAKPSKMFEVVLSNSRTGFDLNACKIAVSILDNKVYFPFVNVTISRGFVYYVSEDLRIRITIICLITFDFQSPS